MNQILISILLSILGIFIGCAIMVVINKVRGNKIIEEANKTLNDAKKKAEKEKRESILEAKEDIHKLKIESEKYNKERKEEIKELENRLLTREKNLDTRDLSLSNRAKLLDDRDNSLLQKFKDIQDKEVEIGEIKNKQLKKLEEISNFSKEKAHNEILKQVEETMNFEISSYIKDRETEAKLEADNSAKNMLVSCMERYSKTVTNELTVSVVTLPNEDMKGRIIGREGRNIRTIEAVTGVDLIIDDTPEAIVISSFDPLRREIAKVTLEDLIKDGRIHPTRIEELYDKTCKEFKTRIMNIGKEAVYELGLSKIDPELVSTIGKLHFRTSYGQNALTHSKEVAYISGIIAGEIGENVTLAKRAGLLHDIGKAIDLEMEGSHVEIGYDLAKKFKEPEVVLNSIQSHHGDTEATSVISSIVAIADALSASRPGARNDSFENYVKRVQDLEKVASEIKGVDKAFALQAGRELRVLVKPEMIDDIASYKMARDIKEKVEAELKYPGTVKITVIRETRALEEAK